MVVVVVVVVVVDDDDAVFEAVAVVIIVVAVIVMEAGCCRDTDVDAVVVVVVGVGMCGSRSCFRYRDPNVRKQCDIILLATQLPLNSVCILSLSSTSWPNTSVRNLTKVVSSLSIPFSCAASAGT